MSREDHQEVHGQIDVQTAPDGNLPLPALRTHWHLSTISPSEKLKINNQVSNDYTDHHKTPTSNSVICIYFTMAPRISCTCPSITS